MKDLTLKDLRLITESYVRMISEAADGVHRKTGRDIYGYDAEGYDILGYDHDGYDRHGRDVFGCDRSGYDEEGYDALGFDREGWNKEGIPSPRMNPEAYGMTPAQAEHEWNTKVEEKRRSSKIALYNRLNRGEDIDGVYIRVRPYSKHGESPFGRNFHKNLDKLNNDLKLQRRAERKERTLKRREARMVDPAYREEMERKKAVLAELRKTPDFREKHNQYQKDYYRSHRLLYGGVKWTQDDILWAATNPVFKAMKARYDKEQLAKQEAERNAFRNADRTH